jgi:hypothetical protein
LQLLTSKDMARLETGHRYSQDPGQNPLVARNQRRVSAEFQIGHSEPSSCWEFLDMVYEALYVE